MSYRKSLERLLDESDAGPGRMFAWLVQALVVVSVLISILDTFPNIPYGFKLVIIWSDWAIVLIFTLEYILRIIASRPLSKYAFSALGIVDLLAIAPYWIVGFDTRSIRVLRLVRLMRLLRLIRYSKALQRLGSAIKEIQDELAVFFMINIMVFIIASLLVWEFEHDAQPEKFGTFLDAAWWSIVTLTTVGYGDVYPVTPMGRLVAGLLVVLAVGMVAFPSGLLAAAFHETARERTMGDHHKSDKSGTTE